MKRAKSLLLVHQFPGQAGLGVVHYNGWTRICAVGRGGIGSKWREGDGVSPKGIYTLRGIHVRADRVPFFKSHLPQRVIRPTDWWCDDPDSWRYNQLMARIPAPEGHEERLWRADHLYDVIVEIGYNDAPVLKHKGSAIFIHAARKGMTPTAGCIALEQKDLLQLAQRLNAGTCIRII